MNWLKQLLIRWLLADHELRLKDMERHFVTKRDQTTGQPIQTLADVPMAQRRHLNQKPKGLSGPQMLKWLEMTDGGRNLPREEQRAGG